MKRRKGRRKKRGRRNRRRKEMNVVGSQRKDGRVNRKTRPLPFRFVSKERLQAEKASNSKESGHRNIFQRVGHPFELFASVVSEGTEESFEFDGSEEGGKEGKCMRGETDAT